jgi:GNAT superfamily N-acetyltransferase
VERLSFAPCPADEDPGAALLAAMRAEIAVLYDGLVLDGDAMPSATPADLWPPGGTFVVGALDGVAVCCGGVKRLDEKACELKRMFVVPEHRGRGVARALLGELERRSRLLGYRVARLDTGPRQPGARHLYESAGYAPIGNFNANPVASFWGEKRL